MECPACKNENPEGNAFCSQCGRPLRKTGSSEKAGHVNVSSTRQSPGGPISLGDTGLIKDSTLHSESHVDSHDHVETHIDSHDQIGAPAVGGSQTLNFSFGAKQETTITKTGERCPICKCLAKDDYFYCESCGKDFICRDHQNRQNFLCIKCSPEVMIPPKDRPEVLSQPKNREDGATERIRLEDEQRRLEKKRQEEEDSVFWQGCQREDTLDSYRRYLSRYPQGKYVSQAATASGAKLADFEIARKHHEMRKEEERQRIEAAISRKRVRTMVVSLVAAVLIVAIGYAGITLIPKEKPSTLSVAGQSGPGPVVVDQKAGTSDTPKQTVPDAVPPTAQNKQLPAPTPAPVTSNQPQKTASLAPPAANNLQQKAQAKPIQAANPAPETSIQPQATIPSAPATASNPQPKDEALEVAVNIIGQREVAKGVEPITVKNDSVLRTNDNLKIYVKPSRDAYIYVLIFDSAGKADMLFPSAQVGMHNHVRGGQTYPVPDGNQWFYLDENTGTENVYVMASLTPMADIDKLLAAMESKGQRQQQEDSKKILAQMDVLKRGVRGIKTGPPRNYKTSIENDIKSVTQIVEGSGSVVWSLSFKHI